MKKVRKYAPHFILIVFVTIFSATRGTFSKEFISKDKEWIAFLVLIVGVILLFEIIESSRPKRIKKWNDKHPGKTSQALKFGIFLGLPISAIIIFIIYNKALLFYLILLIGVPIIIIFGWIGLMDWQTCENMFLEDKYKVHLPG